MKLIFLKTSCLNLILFMTTCISPQSAHINQRKEPKYYNSEQNESYIIVTFEPVYNLNVPNTQNVKLKVTEVARTQLYNKKRVDENIIAYASFENKVNSTGWSYLMVSSNSKYSDEIQAYAAGLAEGASTKQLIQFRISNTIGDFCKNTTSTCAKIKSYFERNFYWMKEQIDHLSLHDSYWYQVKLFLIQMNGLVDSFHNRVTKPSYIIKDVFDFLILMQVNGDLEDLTSAFGGPSKVIGSGSCSALIKILPGFKDVLVSQDTWTMYQDMLRILKTYNLKFRTNPQTEEFIPGSSMSFSSYPGSMTSGDDFYVISSRLVTQETTIGNSNDALWKFIHPENSLPEGIRSMVANRLASDGDYWTSLFSKYNSGTYNNQWMVVNFKKFSPGMEPRKGFLYILEQIPGTIVSKDRTENLLRATYWPSYNVASFPEIFNLSGGPLMVAKYGDWFTYEKTPRALIFRRDHVKVQDMQSMLRLMRYNDFKRDKLSACNCTPPFSAENAIAARCDLNPKDGKYPFPSLGHRQHGAVDAKITSFSLAKNLKFLAIAGPTNEQQPPFQWSKSTYSDLPHYGHPDLFNFKPIIYPIETSIENL